MKLYEFTDPVDRVTMDIPLFIRILELTREDIKSDADLHRVVTNVINASKETDKPLTMDHYDAIAELVSEACGLKKKK